MKGSVSAVFCCALSALILLSVPAVTAWSHEPPGSSSGDIIPDQMTLEQAQQEIKRSPPPAYSKKAATISTQALLQPANPNAAPEAAAILGYLETLPSRPDNRVVSGQFIGHPHPGIVDAYDQYVTELQRQTGEWVGVVGADYDRLSDGETVALSIVNQSLIKHWSQGGLVTVSDHARNPWTGGPARDTTVVGRFLDLITPGTAVNQVWISQLDRLADALLELQAAGVMVLWRPFHESNGKSFWWAKSRSSEEQAALWRHMFQYFTETRGLNNLLWVYSVVPVTSRGVRPVDFGYPGAQYVDIVGLDVYQSDPKIDNEYNKLLSLGKPIGLTEFGPSTSKEYSYDYARLINKVRSRYPRITFFQAWNSVWSLIKQNNANKLLKDSWVLNTGELDWR
jgi:mannan endo-1,4-beta-mannosidase